MLRAWNGRGWTQKNLLEAESELVTDCICVMRERKSRVTHRFLFEICLPYIKICL